MEVPMLLRFVTLALAILVLATSSLLSKPLRESPQRDGEPFFISLQAKANMRLTDTLGNDENNNLGDLPTGERLYAKKWFKVEDGLIQLRGTGVRTWRTTKVEGIKIDRRFAKLHILHATGFQGPYADGDPNHEIPQPIFRKIRYLARLS